MALITKQQIKRVASKAEPRIVTAIVDHAGRVLPAYGLVTPRRIQHFLAHVMVETGGLRRISEDLDYTSARLRQVWPRRFPTLAAAEPYAHRPEALAAVVYGHRMGNTSPAEAWANRGQGLLSTTGHNNFAALAAHLHVTVDQLRAMLTADAWMLECAVASFVMVGAVAFADRDDIEGSTRAVNGGLTDLAARRDALALCRKVWTPAAVIAPAALVPKPTVTKLTGDTPMPTLNDASRIATALEKIAASPQTADLVNQALAGASKGIAAAPDKGWLAGKKSYIVAGLGVASTIATVGFAIVQNGGLSWAGGFAAITALVASGGLASMRSALTSHYGDLAGILLDVGQQIALQIVEAHAPQGASPDDPAMARAAGH